MNEEKGGPQDLIEAVCKGWMESIQAMYDHGNDIYFCDEAKNSLIHYAAKNCQLKVLDFLITK